MMTKYLEKLKELKIDHKVENSTITLLNLPDEIKLQVRHDVVCKLYDSAYPETIKQILV